MSSILFFLISASVCLTLFMIGYQVFLRNNSRFNLCRFYIITSILLSFLIPSTPIDLGLGSIYTKEKQYRVIAEKDISTPVLTKRVTYPTVNKGFSIQNIDFIKVSSVALLAISLLLFLRFLIRFGSIILIQISANRIENEEGLNLIFTNKTNNAFSFLGNIFINPLKFTDEEKRLIIEHEREHIRHFHSVDLILIELLIVLQWFNPFAYFARRKLIEIHEFIADNGVIRNGADPYSYQNLLLSVVTSSCLPSAGNQLSAFITKKRIAMIGKPLNQTGKWISFLVVIPIAAMLVVTISAFTPKNKYVNEQESNTKKELLAKAEKDGITNSIQNIYFEIKPNEYQEKSTITLAGGNDYIFNFIAKSKTERIDAYINSIVKDVPQEATIIFSGSTETTLHVKKTSEFSIRVGNRSSNGKVELLSLIRLKGPHDPKSDTLNKVKSQKNEIEEAFMVVEQMPIFGSGDANEFQAWTAANIKYPEDAAKKGIQGRVFVQFIVEKDGSISNAKVIRGVDPSLDKEAIRVIEASPKWNPGKQRGQAVRVLYTFPLSFSLGKEEKETVVTSANNDEVFLVVEEMPKFGNGDPSEFRTWVEANMKYPEEAFKKGIQGRVFVQFVVERDGSITNVKVVRSVDPLLDKEAIRVVENSPKWDPGKQRGEVVRVAYTFPIPFVLGDQGGSSQQKEKESKSKKELSARAESEVKNTFLKDFYSGLPVNSTQSFSVILKQDVTYKLYMLSTNKSDKLLAKIERKNDEGTTVTVKEKDFSYSSNFAFSPEKTGAYNLIVSNSSTQETDALIVLTMVENNSK